MESYECVICDYVYHPEKGDEGTGVAPGTAFADLPEGWLCPICGAELEQFEPIE